MFLTGSDRIPIHGMASLRIIIQSTAAEEHYLPVAHTCYNMLDMPCYQTKETLWHRLTQAVEQYEGFSLVWAGSTEVAFCMLTLHFKPVEKWNERCSRIYFTTDEHILGLMSKSIIFLFLQTPICLFGLILRCAVCLLFGYTNLYFLNDTNKL